MIAKLIAIVSLVVVAFAAGAAMTFLSTADANQQWHSPKGAEEPIQHESRLKDIFVNLRWDDVDATPIVGTDASSTKTTFWIFFIRHLPNTSAPKTSDCEDAISCALATVYGSEAGQINPLAVALP